MTFNQLNPHPRIRHFHDGSMPRELQAAYAAIAREAQRKQQALRGVEPVNPTESVSAEPSPDISDSSESHNRHFRNYLNLDGKIRESRNENFRMGYIMCPADFLELEMLGLNGAINVAVAYLPGPKAVRGIPITPRREISYVACRILSMPGFLVKQSGFREAGRGDTRLVTCFEELYTLSWVNDEVGRELDAIADAFRIKRDNIQEYLGCAINID